MGAFRLYVPIMRSSILRDLVMNRNAKYEIPTGKLQTRYTDENL